MKLKVKAIGLISILALGLFAAPLPTAAQQAPKVFRVGILSTAHLRSAPHWVAFVQGLRQLGYVEGQNLTVEFRNAEGHLERLPKLAAELARLLFVAPLPAEALQPRNVSRVGILSTGADSG